MVNKPLYIQDDGELVAVNPAPYTNKTGWDLQYKDKVTLSFDDATRTFTITPTGASFSFWVNGTEYTKTTAQTVTITDTAGLWFITFNTSGELTASQTPWSIQDDNAALVAYTYWDQPNSVHIGLGYELHSWAMDAGTHSVLHYTIGAVYGSGFALGNMDVDGSGNDASAAQLSVGNGIFYDEDIEHEITNDSPQQLELPAQLPIFYREGATGLWRKKPATDYIGWANSSRLHYNEWTGTTWQTTEIINNDFGLSHIFATNDTEEPIIIIMGQDDYSNRNNARDGAETEINNLIIGGFAQVYQEFVPIATVILQTSTGFTNSIKSKVVSTAEGGDYVDWRGTATGKQAISGTTDHSLLSNLNADDHTQYPLVDGTRGFTGVVSGVTPTADAHLATKQYVDLGSGAGIINADTTLHISTTGNDSTGDGSSGSPWATIPRALEYLENKLIALDATVTIQLADGNHSYSTQINFSHPCGARISIVGTTLVELSLSSVGTISGTAPDRTIVLNVDSTTNCTAGDLIRIVPTSGGTNRQLLAGASKIVSVNSSTQLTVEWPQQTTSYTPSGSIVGDITVFKTKISCASTGFDVSYSGLGNLNTLAFQGTGATPGHAIRAIFAGTILCGTDIIVYEHSAGIYCSTQCYIRANEIVIGKCTYGIYAQTMGNVRAQGCIINGTSSAGLLCYTSSRIDAREGLITGTGGAGVTANAHAEVNFTTGEVYACVSYGLAASRNSYVTATSTIFALMESHGMYAYDLSIIDAAATNISYCNVGAIATRNCYINVNGGTIQNNYRGLTANYNSIIRKDTATVSSNTDYDISPSPAGTVGNTEAFIID